MNYQRVIPRDLFNEGGLLTALGKLYIRLEEIGCERYLDNQCMPSEGFEITQSQDDGSITCTNVRLLVGDHWVRLTRPLNSKVKWALTYEFAGNEGDVFNRAGQLTAVFRALLRRLEAGYHA